MFELKNCKICGRVYQNNGTSDICPDCNEKDELNFSRIREYLYIHPGASMFEVVTNLDVPISMVKHYLKENRIEIIEGNNSFLHCECCSQPIRSGTHCNDCFRMMHHNYKVIYQEKPSKPSGKINYLSTNDNRIKKVAAR